MNNTFKYKNFIGSVSYSADDRIFCGKIEGINDLVTFEGSTVDELEAAFKYVVDKHIKDCQKTNKDKIKMYTTNYPPPRIIT